MKVLASIEAECRVIIVEHKIIAALTKDISSAAVILYKVMEGVLDYYENKKVAWSITCGHLYWKTDHHSNFR